MKIRFVLHTGFAGAVHKETVDFSDEDLDKISEEEREDYLWRYYNDWKDQQVEGYWEEVEDDE